MRTAVVLAAMFAVLVTFAADVCAQDAGPALAAMVMWDAFDVPERVMEDVTTAPSGGCQPSSRRITCELKHGTSNSTVCRGVAVAYVAGAVYTMVQQNKSMRSTFNLICSKHRVVVDFVPDQRTTVTEYERSSGDVVYKNSIRHSR